MPPAPRHTERVAHRGCPREIRENTLAGFLLALEHGADAIELDVHVSSDGVVVVHHDPEVVGMAITATPWNRLSALDVGGGARMPRLSDVLEAVGDRASVYVELKGAGVEGPALDVIEASGRRAAVHSFDHGAVERAKTIAPDVPRGILLDRGVQDPVGMLRASAARVEPRDVWPHFSLVDAAFMSAATALGTRVIPWTVNSAADARRLHALGVSGICTDDVRLLAGL
jgi:glycerophosphoryl diester phosphodiesterase